MLCLLFSNCLAQCHLWTKEYTGTPSNDSLVVSKTAASTPMKAVHFFSVDVKLDVADSRLTGLLNAEIISANVNNLCKKRPHIYGVNNRLLNYVLKLQPSQYLLEWMK